MLKPGNYGQIPKSQVAVRKWGGEYESSSNTDRRELLGYTGHDSGSVVWFADKINQFHEKMKLFDALEVRIVPED